MPIERQSRSLHTQCIFKDINTSPDTVEPENIFYNKGYKIKNIHIKVVSWNKL